MKNILVIDLKKCRSCETCENVCSLVHEGMCAPASSRVTVLKLGEWEEVSFPLMCQQCNTPYCEKICPVDRANYRDQVTGAMKIDYDRCIGCRLCMIGCPFGVPTISPRTMKIIKCDLCNGDPECVKWCPSGALNFVREDVASNLLKEIWGKRVAALLAETASQGKGT